MTYYPADPSQPLVFYENGTGGLIRSVRGDLLREDPHTLAVHHHDGSRTEINWERVVLITHPAKGPSQ